MDMKRDYYEDVQVFTSKVIVFWLGILILALAVFPFIAKNYYVYVANYMAINVIVVVGSEPISRLHRPDIHGSCRLFCHWCL